MYKFSLGIFFCFVEMFAIVKWTLAFIYLHFIKKRSKAMFEFDHKSKDLGKVGFTSLPSAQLREHPRQLATDDNAIDSIAFHGVNNDGGAIVLQLTRRPNRTAEVWVYLKFPSGEEYQLPIHPHTHIYNTDGKGFVAGGLTFEVLEPLRRWRIGYNGILRKGIHNEWSDSDKDDTVIIKFNLIWRPMYNYIAFPHDLQPKILAELLAHPDSSNLFQRPSDIFSEEWYEQFGHILGTVNIEGQEEVEVMFRGMKYRRHGTFDWNNVCHKISIMGIVDNGTAFHLFADNIDGQLKNFHYGFILPSNNMTIHHINKWKTKLETLKVEDKFTIDVAAGRNDYNLHFTSSSTMLQLFCGENWECQTSIRIYEVYLNGRKGFAIAQSAQKCKIESPVAKQMSVTFLEEPKIKSCQHMTVTFKEIECQSSAFVGGKGASLALMSSLIQKHNPSGVKVTIPDGLCLTKAAFEHHLQSYPFIKNAIKDVENVAWKLMDGSLINTCDRLVEVIHGTELSPILKDNLRLRLMELSGDDYESFTFAVRSSAIGEDGEEMSAAGQNETYLGIKGFHDICSAVVKCWASQFSHRFIEYKRQNGQIINGGMGVVIQEMVPADVAGVLFSHHPLTGSPAYMMIASNYGLGESVVSALANPDTVIIKRSWNDDLDIHEKQIGDKKLKIIMSANFGTTTEVNDPILASECSITDEMAIKLANIAVYFEQSCGGARDIEWAVSNDTIFLLQSRPVTTESAMTDYEVIHEFDSSPPTDHEHYTTGNLGEVMPGCTTPLTQTTEFRSRNASLFVNFSWKVDNHRFDPTVLDGPACFCGHMFFDLVQQKGLTRETTKSPMSKVIDIGLYGRILEDDDIVSMAVERYPNVPIKTQLVLLIIVLKGVLFGKWALNKALKIYTKFHISLEDAETANKVYEIINQDYFHDWSPSAHVHTAMTFTSSIWNFMILNMLVGSSGEYTLEKYTDFAILIGSHNGSESGEVPFKLQQLAKAITEEIDPSKFSEMDTKAATNFCQQNTGTFGKLFTDFLQQYGHRGLNEFEFNSVTWGMDPTKVVHVLQGMLRNPKFSIKSNEQQVESPLETTSTQLTAFKKHLLSFVMSRAQQSMCDREKSKSLLIKTVDGFRQAYRHLGKLMVHEGYLPDANLIFFFTNEEIGQMLKFRSAKLIRRVKQRQRLFPYMDSLVFDEIIVGTPKPIIRKKGTEVSSVVQIKGYPVSQGAVQGTARVTSLEDINTIQPGDILITRATDIGWSPYFPMLGGVVTEIGGLISHGAVIAREFGLPCIVAAQNATEVFKSGDKVFLNANEGTITKSA